MFTNSIPKRIASLVALTVAGAIFAAPLFAAEPPPTLLTPQQLGITGTARYDGWDKLTSSFYFGYGSIFEPVTAWPAPIAANQAGSNGGGVIDRLSGSLYPASSSLYGGFGKSSFVVKTATPVAGLRSLVLQIDVGEGYGDFVAGGRPALRINGSEDLFEPVISSIVDQANAGSMMMPTGPNGESEEQPIYINHWLFQWDLRGLTAPITSVQLVSTVAEHAQIYKVQLDQRNVFIGAVEYLTPSLRTYELPEGVTNIGDANYLNSAALSPDGKFVAATVGSGDNWNGVIQRLNTTTGAFESLPVTDPATGSFGYTIAGISNTGIVVGSRFQPSSSRTIGYATAAVRASNCSRREMPARASPA